MGMYTQIRGWLNVDSIGYNNLQKIGEELEQAICDFQNDTTIEVDRKWIANDTIVHSGGNGSVYIFFGTELKNYGNPAYEWIKFLLKYFPNAEGRIDFQYEEENYWEDINIDVDNNDLTRSQLECAMGDESRYLLIRDGKIIKDDYTRTWCKGYGNMYEK